MKTLLIPSVLVLGLFAITPAYAADDPSCQALFTKADANGDGTVGGPELAAYKDAYAKSGGNMNETTQILTKEQFVDACMKDAFKDMPQ
jgi:hypothetical protein